MPSSSLRHSLINELILQNTQSIFDKNWILLDKIEG